MNNVLEMLQKMQEFDTSISDARLGTPFAFDPTTILGQSQMVVAKAFGSPFAFIGTNGTTALNTLALATYATEDSWVIAMRNCHVSVIGAATMIGFDLKWLVPEYDPKAQWNLAPRLEDFEALLQQGKALGKPMVAHFTYPLYSGFAFDLKAFVEVAHKNGVKVIVDAAHGSYFQFHPDMPMAAVASGADIVLHSLHKTLGAVSQTSAAFIQNPDDIKPFYKAVNKTNAVTTSMCFPLVASAEFAAHQMQVQGHDLLETAIKAANKLRAEINLTPSLHTLEIDPSIGQLDPLRITFGVTKTGVDGYTFEALLAEHKLIAEMATLNAVTLLLTPFDHHLEDILATIRAVAASLEGQPPLRIPDLPPPSLPQYRLSPRKASGFTCSQIWHQQYLPVRYSIGRTSAETIACYPPGSAIVVAGEIITAEIVNYLEKMVAHGAHLKGAFDPTFQTIEVLGIRD
jgi:arginine decarboxylase